MGSDHQHAPQERADPTPVAPGPTEADGPAAPFPLAVLASGHPHDAAEFDADRVADHALQRVPPIPAERRDSSVLHRAVSGGADGSIGWAGGPLDGAINGAIEGLRVPAVRCPRRSASGWNRPSAQVSRGFGCTTTLAVPS